MDNQSVLLVEDNSADEALIKRAFTKAQVKNELVVMRDGAAALDYLFGSDVYANRDLKHKPMVIFLDLKLPKIDGLEVLKRLRADARTKLLPIVILTSSKEAEDLSAAYKNGANSYIVKPINDPHFSDCIKQMAKYWVGLSEPVPH